MQWEVPPVDPNRPCHLTSDSQCVHEEMCADTLSRVDGSNPVTPGLLTASDGQLLQPPTLLPLASVRVLWQFQGTLGPHLLMCWDAGCPRWGGRDRGPCLSHQPSSNTARWLLCCNHSVSSHGELEGRRWGAGEDTVEAFHEHLIYAKLSTAHIQTSSHLFLVE